MEDLESLIYNWYMSQFKVKDMSDIRMCVVTKQTHPEHTYMSELLGLYLVRAERDRREARPATHGA